MANILRYPLLGDRPLCVDPGSISKEKLKNANQIGKAVYIVTLTAMGMSAADNSLGTWKRNMERTKYDQKNPPSNPITSQTTVREAAEGGVKNHNQGHEEGRHRH